MVAELKPQTYLVEVDFLQAWELVNSLMERRERLRRLALRNSSVDTAIVLSARVEQKVRDAAGIPIVEDDWSEAEMRFAYGDR